MPYRRRALGVDPPLWSSAAINPSFPEICAIILSFAMIITLAFSCRGCTGPARTFRGGRWTQPVVTLAPPPNHPWLPETYQDKFEMLSPFTVSNLDSDQLMQPMMGKNR